MKKLLLSISLLLISASLSPSISFAQFEKKAGTEGITGESFKGESGKLNAEVISTGEVILEKKLGKVFDKNDGAEIVSITGYNDDGTPIDISVDKYFEIIKAEAKLLESNPIVKSNNLNEEIGIQCVACVGGVENKYLESSASNLTGTISRVSNPSANCTLDSSTKTLSFSATKSHSTNISLTSPELNAFKAGVSYTFISSSSRTGTDQITIRPNYKGWFDFSANLRKSSGTLITRLGNKESKKQVTSTYPKVLGGKLDGVTIGKVSALTAAEKKTYCEK